MSAASIFARVRPALSLLASLYVAVQLCLVVWVAAPTVALGWSPTVVLSNSMSPDVRAGDVVLVGRSSTELLPVGTLAVFDTKDSDEPTIHRIVENSGGTYRTKGDANPTVDPVPLKPSEVRGVGRLLVPTVGLPAMWFQTGRPVLAIGWLVSAIGALLLSRRRSSRARARRRSLAVTP